MEMRESFTKQKKQKGRGTNNFILAIGDNRCGQLGLGKSNTTGEGAPNAADERLGRSERPLSAGGHDGGWQPAVVDERLGELGGEAIGPDREEMDAVILA